MSVPTINLLPRETLIARDRRRWVRRWAIAVAGAVVLVGMGVAGNVAPKLTDDDAVRDRLGVVRARVTEINAQLPPARAHLASVTRRLSAADRVRLRPDWGALLAYLERLRGHDVVLERVVVETDADGRVVLRLHGLSGVQGREGVLVLGLERSGLFESTTLVRTQRVNVRGQDRISFEVESVFGGESAVTEAPTP